jgi:hypothetical protein
MLMGADLERLSVDLLQPDNFSSWLPDTTRFRTIDFVRATMDRVGRTDLYVLRLYLEIQTDVSAN